MVDNYFNIGDAYNIVENEFGEEFTISTDLTDLHTGLFHKIDDKNKGIDTMYLLTNTYLQQGNIIQYRDINYIVITKNEENNQDTYNKYIVRKCPYNINFSINTSMNTVVGYIETKTIDVTTGQTIILPTGTIIVTMPLNSITNQIKVNDRFIKMKSAWKVTGLDLSLEGLLKITADIDTVQSGDDLINEIPAGSYFYNYVMTVSPESITIDAGTTQQITTTITNSGTTVENPNLTYTSDNTDIATIDNTGLVSAIAEGNCNITVSFVGADGNTYTKTIPTVINAVVAKTVRFFNGTSEITTQPYKLLNADTVTITAYAYNGDMQTADIFTFAVTSQNGGDSSYYKLTVVDGNKFNLENIKGDGGEYVTITATGADGVTTADIKIRLAGEW
jgi:hypothetical protein